MRQQSTKEQRKGAGQRDKTPAGQLALALEDNSGWFRIDLDVELEGRSSEGQEGTGGGQSDRKWRIHQIQSNSRRPGPTRCLL